MNQSGIGTIINKSTGKIYIFKSNNLKKRLEDYKIQLSANYHHNSELQKDWNEFGPESFEFKKEVIEDDKLLDETLNNYLNNDPNIYSDVKNPKLLIKPFRYEIRLLYEELYALIGRSKINEIFLNKLEINNLGKNFYIQIRKAAEYSIENGQVKIGEVEKLLDDLIDEIAKNKENENVLIKYVLNITGIDDLNDRFKSKLDNMGIDYNKGFTIKENIIYLIKSHKIIDISEIDSKMDKLLEIELINANMAKESLFKQLRDIINSKDFKSKLKVFNIDENFTETILLKYENCIKTYKIKEGFDFENSLNQDILEKKVDDLLIKLNEIFVDVDFRDELNKFLLNDIDANEIRLDLTKNIKTRKIDELIILENNGLRNEVDKYVLERYGNIKHKVINLREKLLNDLYSLIEEKYSPKINQDKLSNEIVDNVRNKIEKIITSDEIISNNFNYKIDELYSLEKTTIPVVFESLLDSEKSLEQERLNKLRHELKLDFSVLCSNSSDSFINIKLREYELPLIYLDKTVEKINQLIYSEEIIHENFNSKLEELTYFKENTFKNEIINILIEFKEIADEELEELYEITGHDSLSNWFLNSLRVRGLNENAGRKIIHQTRLSILEGTISVDLETYIDNCLDKLEFDKNRVSQILENTVGHDAKNPLFVKRLKNNNLDSEIHGMKIKNIMDELIQSAEVNSENFAQVLSNEIEYEVKQKNIRLKKGVDDIIGLSKIKKSFLYRIGEFNLDETDAKIIRSEVLDAIDNNELDEFAVFDEIENIVQKKGNIKLRKLLIKRVNYIIGGESINSKFSYKLSMHDLDNGDGQIIKNNILNGVESGKINFNNFDDSVAQEIYLRDSFHVKNDLKRLSSNQIEFLFKKYSLSSFLPFKSEKINKLSDNVELYRLKRDLASFGFSKYKPKYDVLDEDFKICINCGSKLDLDAKFCIYCGKKLN